MQQYSIKQLRHLLLNEPEFDITKDYFFNWVTEHNKTARANLIQNKKIVQIVNMGLSDAFQTDIAIENTRMYEVKNIHFIHGMGSFGSGIFGKGHAVFFYFSDLDWGMIIGVTMTKCQITRFRMLAHGNLNFKTDGQEN